MRPWIPLLALSLSGCDLYFGSDNRPTVDDDDGPWYPPPVDAGPVVDAPWPNCTWPTGTSVTVCGSVRDVATSGTLADAYQVELTYYDAMELINTPDTAIPLYPAGTFLGYLGDFSARDIPWPGSGLLAIVVDDSPTTGLDRYRRTVTVLQVSGGSFIEYARGYALRADTDWQWSQEVGITAPPTIVDQGAILQCFEYGAGQQAVGITATEAGATDPDSIYFGDTSAYTREQLNPTMTVTGANGCVLDRASALVEHSGVDGPLVDCWWESKLAVTLPNTLFVSTLGPICPI